MIKVVGLPYNEYEKVKRFIKINSILRLVNEPDNKVDKNAMAVYFDILDGDNNKELPHKIGYISIPDQHFVDSDLCMVKEIHKTYILVIGVYI
jgi:hypothetical protein